MPKFVHIDQSLCQVGGHEYECALNVLTAAEAAGYRVALATNRRFRHLSGLPDRWPIYPLFPHTAYSRHCVSYGGHVHLPLDLDGGRLEPAGEVPRKRPLNVAPLGGLQAVWQWVRRRVRRRAISGFAEACKRLFTDIRLDHEDHVFFTTFSEFDLLGLTRFLADDETSRRADWHLLFHFDLFEGREPYKADQETRRLAVRRQWEHALGHLRDHRIHFYCATEQLAAQYNRLDVAPFEYLPYPVSTDLESRGRLADHPLRVTCAGSVRREKGTRQLGSLMSALRSEPRLSGKVQVVAQLSRPKRGLRDAVRAGSARDAADVRLSIMPHPLAAREYHELIRRADVGLFLHDPERYHVRCSAVLQEMLAAGTPVIVPAGCWLAEQIAEPIFRHVEALRQILPPVDRWRASDAARFFTDSQPMARRLPVPDAANEIIVSFRWTDPVPRGSWARVEFEQLDRDGNTVELFESILGQRRADGPVLTLHHLDPRAAQIELRLRNAYDGRRLEVADWELEFFDARDMGGCPAGCVGLIAARHAYIPRLLADMAGHYSHYRDSAEVFSRNWRKSLHPARTIAMLTSKDVEPAERWPLEPPASQPDDENAKMVA
jgi:hypothetical protein